MQCQRNAFTHDFSLRLENDQVVGPFALKEGATIALGTNAFVLEHVCMQRQPHASESELRTRRYAVLPETLDKILGGVSDVPFADANAPEEEKLKQRLTNLGIHWPAGSKILYRSIWRNLIA